MKAVKDSAIRVIAQDAGPPTRMNFTAFPSRGPRKTAARSVSGTIAMEPRCCLMCGKKMQGVEGVSMHMRDVHRATFTWARIAGEETAQ